MRPSDAVALLRPALGEAGGTWADFGAGQGTFTEALAAVLGERSSVIAVERNAHALPSLERVAERHAGGARIIVASGDFLHLDGIQELRQVQLDGALFANALHYVPDPAGLLERVAHRVRPGGRVVIIEYDRATSNRWVPHPLPAERLRVVAERAGLGKPDIVGRRPSAYHGEMYCAVMLRPHRHDNEPG